MLWGDEIQQKLTHIHEMAAKTDFILRSEYRSCIIRLLQARSASTRHEIDGGLIGLITDMVQIGIARMMPETQFARNLLAGIAAQRADDKVRQSDLDADTQHLLSTIPRMDLHTLSLLAKDLMENFPVGQIKAKYEIDS